MTYRLTSSLIALTTALSSPAIADVTATDVWANQQALISAAGGTLAGTVANGSVTPELNIILPDGAASLKLTADAISMTDNADGSVTISYPSPMKVSVAGGVRGEGNFALEMTVTHDGYTATATGDPGDIAYVTAGDNLRVDFGNLTLDGQDDTDLAGFLTLASFANNSRITEGNLIRYASQSSTGNSTANFSFGTGNVTTKTTQTTNPTQTTIAAMLPVGGADVMNLSQAIRDGLDVMITSSGEGSTSSSVATIDGEPLTRQENSTTAQNVEFRLGEEGFGIDASGSDVMFMMEDTLTFPIPLDFAMSDVSMNYAFPINASDANQDFRAATSLRGFTMGDAIWDLFDPAAQLPRDPAEISFDLKGTGTTGIDLLDFDAVSMMSGLTAVQVDNVTIENLRIAAVGAEATAQGALTFDWDDFQTIPGVPRPEGSVTINLNGANALMDTLVEMGFIPAEDLMMPRMMMGMFATPVGDDMLQSVIEVNEQGHVLANGQRLQ